MTKNTGDISGVLGVHSPSLVGMWRWADLSDSALFLRDAGIANGSVKPACGTGGNYQYTGERAVDCVTELQGLVIGRKGVGGKLTTR